MPYNWQLLVLTQAKCGFRWKTAVLRFWALVGRGSLRATYDVHLRFTGKRVVDFLLVLIELFSLGVTTEALRANIGSKSAILLQRRAGLSKISFRKGRPRQPFSSQKTRLKCSFVWYNNLHRSFFRFVTMHAFDRQTNRRTDGWTDRQLSPD